MNAPLTPLSFRYQPPMLAEFTDTDGFLLLVRPEAVATVARVGGSTIIRTVDGNSHQVRQTVTMVKRILQGEEDL